MLTSTVYPFVGGLEVVVHNLATALIRAGHRVYHVTPGRTHRNRGVRDTYPITRFGFKGYGRLKLARPAAVCALSWTVWRHRIDVVHVHNVFTPASWAMAYKRLFPCTPVIGTPHGDDIQTAAAIGYGVRLDPRCDNIVRRNVAGLNRVTAISASVEKELRDMGVPAECIDRIPNGIWFNRFQPCPEKSIVRQKYAIPADAGVLICVGRNHPVKGYATAVEALARLRKDGSNVVLVMAGREMESICRLAGQLGVAGALITPGQLGPGNVAELLGAADIFISSSHMESFGLTTLEAMASGLPCVVTNVPGNRDLVRADFGELVAAGDAGQLADAIRPLLGNPELRRDMGVKARELARNYDWPLIAEKYVAAYRKTIETVCPDRAGCCRKTDREII